MTTEISTERFKTNNGNWHMIDHGGNHFINGRCVNPLDKPHSESDLVYTTKKDDEGNVIGYTSNAREVNYIGSTYPMVEDIIKTPVITGHVPLEQRGTDKYGKPKMYVKRGYEHLITNN